MLAAEHSKLTRSAVSSAGGLERGFGFVVRGRAYAAAEFAAYAPARAFITSGLCRPPLYRKAFPVLRLAGAKDASTGSSAPENWLKKQIE